MKVIVSESQFKRIVDNSNRWGLIGISEGRKMTQDEFIEKAKTTKEHQNPDGTPKYTYDKVNYVKGNVPVIITCPIHGDWDTTTPSSHLGGTGCPKCGNEDRNKKTSSTASKFIEQAKATKQHQNPDGTPKYTYDKVNYVNTKVPVIITCPIHGDWDTTTPHNHLQGSGCPKCGIEDIAKKNISTTSKFIEQAKAKKEHQNPDGTPKYNYDKVNYVHYKVPVIITCPIHDDFPLTPNKHLNGRGCKYCAMEGRSKNTISKAASKFIEQSKATKKHQNPDGTPKYTYDKVNYVKGNVPVIITCPIHGDWDTTSPTDHLRGIGCPFCAGNIKKTTDKFIEQAKEKHKNPDGTPKYTYDKVNYVGSYIPVIITCPIHGDFPQTPNTHLKGSGCPKCRESKGEKMIYNYLEQKEYDVVPQKPFEDCNNKHKDKKICREYKFDFYLPQFNTLIEYDGEQHFRRLYHFHKTEEQFQELVEDDRYKNNYCKDKIRLIRISYNEKDIIGQLEKGLLTSRPKELWLSDNYPKAGWNK
jgi:predicted nucleic-acid-binding Zn-ribbon protein